MAEHELKIWPSHFEAVMDGRKPFEVRRADRDFRVGDTLRLKEFDPDPHRRFSESDWTGFTGRQLRARVTYLVNVGAYAVKYPLVVMGLGELSVIVQEPTE